MTTKATNPRTERFAALRRDIGLTIPQLAEALERPRGTLMAYTHSGIGSRPAPQAVIDAMEELLLKRSIARIEDAKRIAADLGYVLIPAATSEAPHAHPAR